MTSKRPAIPTRTGSRSPRPPCPHDANSKIPHALTLNEIAGIRQAFVDAAKRADRAGFDVVELHFAHGYLMNQFLSAARQQANRRLWRIARKPHAPADRNRGSGARRLAGGQATFRPHLDPGLASRRLAGRGQRGFRQGTQARGVDVIDCSSGGFAEGKVKPAPGYQLGFSDAVRKGADIATMTVGLMGDPAEAEAAVADGKADLVALARPALEDPNWPVRSMADAGLKPDVYGLHAKQTGYAVKALHTVLGKV